jgi:glycosyltransferase involved in cell wall biosynthesis
MNEKSVITQSQKANPVVSVIIPTFNRADFLDRALSSVLLQTYRRFEILVVDDGSTDSTAELVETWKTKFAQAHSGPILLKYIQTKNRGVSAARNAGICAAKAEWIAFLDSDDEWLPSKLEMQMNHARQNPEFSLIHSEEIWIRNGVRVNQPVKYKKRGGWVFLDCLPLCFIGPSTVLIKKTVLEKFGNFREEFPVCEDYMLWLQISLKNPVGFIETPLTMKYGGHPDQLSHSLKAMDYYRVLAIDEILKENFEYIEWKEQARRMLLEKCEVLLKGYLKHDNLERYSEILTLKERWACDQKKELP